MEVKRSKLLAALKLCKPGVGSASSLGVEGLHCFIFRNNRIYSHNDYISVSVAFPSDLSIAVSADEFYHLISSLKDEISLVQEGSILTVKSGKSTSRIHAQSEDVYKRILTILPEVPEWKLLPAQFNHYMDICNSKGILEEKVGVFVEGNNIVSYTKHVVNWVQMEEKLERMWFSTKAASALTKFPDFTYYDTSSSWFHFKNDDIVFSCRGNVVDEYDPEDVYNLIRSQEIKGPQGKLDAEGLELFKRVCIFQNEDAGHPCIELSFSPDKMEVHSKNAGGEISDELPVEYDGPPFTIRVDGKKIVNSLEEGKTYEFQIGYVKDEVCSVIFRESGWTGLFSTYVEVVKGKKEKANG